MRIRAEVTGKMQVKLLKLQRMYNNVIAQTTSASGRFLFAGNRFGDIFVQSIEDFEQIEQPRSKVKIFPQGDQTEIDSLSVHRHFLIVGTIGSIYGLKWDEEKGELITERIWEVKIPMRVDAFQVPDVNCLWLRAETEHLYAGCGDNVIYQISIEDGRIVRDYREHTDYLYDVTSYAGRWRFSAFEDGTVHVWCEEQKESTITLEPNQPASLVRPEYGKWIGAVAVSNDWLILRSGPQRSSNQNSVRGYFWWMDTAWETMPQLKRPGGGNTDNVWCHQLTRRARSRGV